MDLIKTALDLVLHIDKHLGDFIAHNGAWTYALLFAIIFCETGLVVTPFLPGDSLLFTAGALAARFPEHLSMAVLIGLLGVGAIIGDTLNYAIGRSIGFHVLNWKLPFVKLEHLQRTQTFYERYGSKMIVLARFVPIVRTFAPFVAGIGKMRYATFITYNVVGGLAWVAICLVAGYFFGNMPVVKKNFELVVIGIVLVSMLPMLIEYLRARKARPVATPDAG